VVVLFGHFLFRLQEDGTIPYLMICNSLSLVKHAIQWFVLVSAPTSAST
jgi:hypothetical protein